MIERIITITTSLQVRKSVKEILMKICPTLENEIGNEVGTIVKNREL